MRIHHCERCGKEFGWDEEQEQAQAPDKCEQCLAAEEYERVQNQLYRTRHRVYQGPLRRRMRELERIMNGSTQMEEKEVCRICGDDQVYGNGLCNACFCD